MSEQDPPIRPPESCLPGDIIVFGVSGGFLIGRLLPTLGPGSWWDYVKCIAARDLAIREACGLAAAAQVRAWVHRQGEVYDEILED